MNESAHAPLLAGQPIGVVGAGHMGGAIIRGLAHARVSELRVHDLDAANAAALPATPASSAAALVETCALSFLAVKPWQMEDLLRSLPPTEGILVSVAAGVSLARLRAAAPAASVIVRAMPNTPVAIGKGCIALCFENETPPEVIRRVEELCSLLGTTTTLPREADMHAFTALAGSGPAFIHTLLDALADAAVAEGMTRTEARRIAAAMTSGAAELALRSGDGQPAAALRDAVASPSGTTIEGLLALEAAGARHAFAEALRAAARRSRQMEEGA